MSFNHYVLFYLEWMDKLNILTMTAKIWHLLRIMKKFEIWEVIRKLLKVKFAVNPV